MLKSSTFLKCITFFISLHHNNKHKEIMGNTDKDFKRLLERVISLKDNLYGIGNWKKAYLPKNSEECLQYIKYCKKEFHIIG